jgi:MYXO-CTERM domain-containing protein
MSPHLRCAIAMLGLGLLGCHEHVGCTPALTGEASQLQFFDATLVASACDRIHGVRAIVAGSRFCPVLACHPDVPGCGDGDDALTSAQVAACHDAVLAGPIEYDDDGCMVAIDEGELDWSFTPIACAANAEGYAPAADRLRLPIVAADEITAWLETPGDAFAVRDLIGADGAPFPDDAQLGPGREALVLADARVPFAVVLGHPDHAEPVAWNPDAWTIEAVAGEVELEWSAWGVVELALPAGTTVDLALRRMEDDLVVPVGRVRAIEATAVASLDVIVGFVPDDEAPESHRAPVGARAVARTHDGAPVWGIPVQWEVTQGALPVWRDAELPWSTDYVALLDREARACHAPPERETVYEATVVAHWGEFAAESAMRWREEPVDESAAEEIKEFFAGEDHEDADACEGPGFPEEGCSCASSRPNALGLALGVVVVLALRRRRGAVVRPVREISRRAGAFPTER